MSKHNNDIVNVNANLASNYNNNDNVIASRYARARNVERIADLLIEKFGLTDDSRPFMCKVAWKLSESIIWTHYETSQTAKKSKVGLFIWLCKRDGV